MYSVFRNILVIALFIVCLSSRPHGVYMNVDTFCWFIHVDICTLHLGISVSLTPLRLFHSVGNLTAPNCGYIISAYCRSSLYSIFGNNELTTISTVKGFPASASYLCPSTSANILPTSARPIDWLTECGVC